MGKRIELNNAEETIALGEEIGKHWKPNQILALQGDLGAGKTTFVQGLLAGLGIQDAAQSPTFTYLQIYEEKVYHFDLYRLQSEQDFRALGFEEFFFNGGYAVIEWPERISSILPPETELVQLEHCSGGRKATITTWGHREI
jgi:tRNA threonylcarbamoyladenosine biosynthesis protein TsaE